LLNRIRNEVLERTRNDYLALADNDELADLDRLLEFFEQSLEYILRIHLKRRHSLDALELDVEIERIRSFLKRPIDENEPKVQEQPITPLR
jgi:hypothetical protein